MKRAIILLVGLAALGLAGCGSNAYSSNNSDSPLVGKWIVSIEAAPADSQKDYRKLFAAEGPLTGYDPQDVVNIAIKRRALALDDSASEMETEFLPDGYCSFTDGLTRDEGTWTLSGDTFTQRYRGQSGKPGTVTWDGRDKFILTRPDGPALAFVRAK